MIRMAFRKKKTNWDRISDTPKEKQSAFRNVYEEQQMERSGFDPLIGKFWYTFGAVLIGLLAAGCVYLLVVGFSYFGSAYQAVVAGDVPFLDLVHAGTFFWGFTYWRAVAVFGTFLLVTGICQMKFMRLRDAQNAARSTVDINQYENDQHIQVPEEVQRNYDWFPDVGAHSNVQVSSMISHMALSNKGLKTVSCAKRAKKDILDPETGEVVVYKGDVLRDEDGEVIFETKPMIDVQFMEELFDASEADDRKEVRRRFDATKIPYNPGNKNRDKQKGFDRVSDLINKDWTFPEYEVQRPGGAYIVDTAPVNTMVLAITRAGKGQTVIESTMDMWTRENRLNNIVANDPKGELLVKFYVKMAVRGYEIVQFNLINVMNTDIYNRAKRYACAFA